MKFTILDILIKPSIISLSREELNFLIEKSFQISSAFIKSKYSSKINFPDKTPDELAMDAIIPLFIKTNDGKIGISKSLENWEDNLETEADFEYFLSRIIWKRVEQTITKELKYNDPIFEKIIKTLNFCIKNNDFIKIRYFGTVFVVRSNHKEIGGKLISDVEFENIPNYYFGLKQYNLFNELFEYIENETEFFPAIPLNHLVKRVKIYYSTKFTLPVSFNDNSDEIISISSLVNEALEDVKEKIDVYYVKNNKLSKNDAYSIYNAFDNISKDIMNGGLHSSLYKYLKTDKENLTKEEFYRNYHHIMNYLLSRMKSTILEKLEY